MKKDLTKKAVSMFLTDEPETTTTTPAEQEQKQPKGYDIFKETGIAAEEPATNNGPSVADHAEHEPQQALKMPAFVYNAGSNEKKTKRVQLVLKPSVYEKLKKQATEQGASVNDFIHQLLENVLG